jgi:hypothetical protein
MVHKEEIETFLARIRELEKLVHQVDGGTISTSSFFEQAFDCSSQLLRALNDMELKRVERLQKQIKEQCVCIEEISARVKAEEQKLRELMTEKPKQANDSFPESLPKKEDKEAETVVRLMDVEKAVTAEKEEKPVLSLNEIIAKKQLSDLWKSFSLNDRFLFRRELFGGDEARMTKVINDLNEMSSFEDSISYIEKELNWNSENKAVIDFISRLEKRFH